MVDWLNLDSRACFRATKALSFTSWQLLVRNRYCRHPPMNGTTASFGFGDIAHSYFFGFFGLFLGSSLASLGFVRLATASVWAPSTGGFWSFVEVVAAGVAPLSVAVAVPPGLKSARRAGFGGSLKTLILYRMMPRMRSSTNLGSHIASSYYKQQIRPKEGGLSLA